MSTSQVSQCLRENGCPPLVLSDKHIKAIKIKAPFLRWGFLFIH